MFRKLIFSICTLLGLFILSTHLHATDVLIEAKGAYFLPTDDKFREIYSGGGMYGGELTCQFDQRLYGWISADFFSKTGSSIGEHDSTRITIVPLGIGLKYLFPLNSVDLYLGGGVLGSYLHMNDHSPFVIRRISKWGVGGIAKVGAFCKLSKYFFADLFISYTSTKIDFHNTHHGKVTRRNADLSGSAFGIGIGYRFGCQKQCSDENKFIIIEKENISDFEGFAFENSKSYFPLAK